MKIEAYLFGAVAAFFLAAGAGYGWWSHGEPAGTAALAVSFLMSSLLCFFFAWTYRRGGLRPEDRKEAAVADRAGPLGFFPARSSYPPVVAAGAAVSALGIVFGLWLFLIGFGILASGVAGMTFQYARRGD